MFSRGERGRSRPGNDRSPEAGEEAAGFRDLRSFAFAPSLLLRDPSCFEWSGFVFGGEATLARGARCVFMLGVLLLDSGRNKSPVYIRVCPCAPSMST